MQIVGVSFDSVQKNEDWAIAEGFQFDLWTDAGRELAMYYGAADTVTAGSARRITVLLDANGVLTLEYLTSINTGTHPDEVLEDIQAIFGP